MKKLFLLLALSMATQSTELQAMNFLKRAANIITLNWLFKKKDVPKIDIQKLNESGLQFVQKVVPDQIDETKKQIKKKFTCEKENEDDFSDWEVLGELKKQPEKRNPLMTSTIHEGMEKEDLLKYVQETKETPKNRDEQNNAKKILSQNKMLISFHEERENSVPNGSDDEKEEPFLGKLYKENTEEIEEFCTSNMQPETQEENIIVIKIGKNCPITQAVASQIIKDILENHQWAFMKKQSLVYTPKNLNELVCYQNPEMNKKILGQLSEKKRQEMEQERWNPVEYDEELAKYVKKEEEQDQIILREEFELRFGKSILKKKLERSSLDAIREKNLLKNDEFHIHDRNPLYQNSNAGLTPQEYLLSCKTIHELTKKERKKREEKEYFAKLEAYTTKEEHYQHSNKNRGTHYKIMSPQKKKKRKKRRFIQIDLTSLHNS